MSKTKRCGIRSLLIILLLLTVPAPIGLTEFTVIAAVKITAPSFRVKEKTLYAGYKTFNLKIDNLVKNAVITYKSSNAKIAKVDKKGKVTPLAKGTVTITASINQSGKKYSIKTKVKVGNPSVTILDRTSNLKVGEQFTFKAKVTGMKDKITWSVSDDSIAVINRSTGKLKANAVGKVKVTAQAGGKKKTYDLEVKASGLNDDTEEMKELSAKEIYSKCAPATVEIIASLSNASSQGSGFFISNGMVVTNYHVIEGAKKIEITTHEGIKYTVDTILGYDKDIDIAILSIPSFNTVLARNQNGVSVGEKVYALGSPLGLTGTLTDGIVSTASRKDNGVDYIQITAAISSGNSGGPLINTYGEVMGINTMTIVEDQNLNFSINISELDRIKTESPITVSEYSKINSAANTTNDSEAMDGPYVFEDPSKSNAMSTCQEILSEYGVFGELTPNSMLDFYYFKLNKKTEFSAAMISPEDNVTDLKNMFFVVVDSNEKIILESYYAQDYSYEYIYGNLSAGEYYIAVYPSHDYYNKTTQYCFSIIY